MEGDIDLSPYLWPDASQGRLPSIINGVNWGNPLTDGLAVLATRSDGALREWVSGQAPASDSSTLTSGILGSESAYTNQQSTFSHRAIYDCLGALTIIVIFDLNSLSNYGALVSKNAGTTTNLPYELRVGAAAADSHIEFVRANASAYKAWDASSASNLFSAGTKNNCIAVTQSADMSAAPIFIANGVVTSPSLAGGTGSGAPTSDGGSLYLGKRGDGVTYLDGAEAIVAVWNGRQLSAGEIESVRRCPGQLLA